MILTIIRDRPARGEAANRPREAKERDIEDELGSFCRAMKIISRRDMDGTVTVVFRSILTKGRAQPVGSSELAGFTHLNRVTIIHHLQRLEQMGLVEHTERKYRLRPNGLCEAVERMREEMLGSLREAEELAGQLEAEFMLHAQVGNAPQAGTAERPAIAPRIGAAPRRRMQEAQKNAVMLPAARDRPKMPKPKKRER